MSGYRCLWVSRYGGVAVTGSARGHRRTSPEKKKRRHPNILEITCHRLISKPRQVGEAELAVVDVQAAEFGAAVELREDLAGI